MSSPRPSAGALTRWVAALGATTVSLTLCAGCGLPEEGTGRPIGSLDVPYELLSPSPEPKQTPTVVGPLVITPSVYLVDGEDRLVPRPLMVDAGSTGAIARQVLTDLEDGPSLAQRAAGLSSSLNAGVELRLRQVDGTTAEVEVALALRGPSADQLPLVVGQIVLSLTSIEGLDSVVLLSDGEPVEAPLPSGVRTKAPVTRDDYAALLASVPTTSSAGKSP
jgi:hypothetical protein